MLAVNLPSGGEQQGHGSRCGSADEQHRAQGVELIVRGRRVDHRRRPEQQDHSEHGAQHDDESAANDRPDGERSRPTRWPAARGSSQAFHYPHNELVDLPTRHATDHARCPRPADRGRGIGRLGLGIDVDLADPPSRRPSHVIDSDHAVDPHRPKHVAGGAVRRALSPATTEECQHAGGVTLSSELFPRHAMTRRRFRGECVSLTRVAPVAMIP